MDTVTMKNPETGEIRDVPANPETLTPLMVQGWVQVHQQQAETPKKEKK